MRRIASTVTVLSVCAAGGLTAAPLFTDITPSAGISFTNVVPADIPGESGLKELMVQTMGNGAAVGDYDDDGDLDIYFCGQLGSANKLYRNELDLGTKTFVDVTTPALANTDMSRSAHFVDLDDDDDLDLLLVNDSFGEGGGTATSVIYRNDDGVFNDVTTGSGFAPVGYLHCGTAITDYNLDGQLDIYATVWILYGLFGPPAFPGYNTLHENQGGMIFQDVSVAAGFGEYTRDCFSAIFSDFDDDGDFDLYQAIDNRDDVYWWNEAGTFVIGTDDVQLDHFGNDMGATACDFDDDGDLDIYTTNITDPSGAFGSTQYNCLYVNKTAEMGGTVWFEDEALAHGVHDTYWGWGVEWFDAENDGDVDLVAATGMEDMILALEDEFSPIYDTPTVLLVNDGSGNFTRALFTGLQQKDDGRGLVTFDFDRDGDLDILTTNIDDTVRLYENITLNQGHWLEVRLKPDAKAVGARVYATIGGVTKRRDIVHGDSYLVGTPSEVHFGLGAETLVTTLEIHWADGFVESHSDVAADQVVTYERGALSTPTAGGAPDITLGAPYPNPSRALFTVPYSLDEAATLEMSVFEPSGRLVHHSRVNAGGGSGIIGWNGRTDGDVAVTPGVYVYKITANGTSIASGKFVVSR